MFRKYIICVTAVILLAVVSSAFSQIAGNPRDLKYKPLVFTPPDPAQARSVLPNGMIVYITEDHTLPTLDIQAIIRTGGIYDPPDKVGLAAMTGSVMRTGGTSSISGDDLDERLVYLGGSISTSVGNLNGEASLFVLSKDTDEGVDLFADVLMHPAFAEDKIKLYKDEAIDRIKNKNDNPRAILGREFNKLLYGNHPYVWEESKKSIDKISREDLLAFYKTYFVPNNMILAVAGDFNKKEMLQKIEKAFAGWQAKKVGIPALPKVTAKNRPGVFMIEKEINQGYINVGHFGTTIHNPDVFALDVMNFILGGGSFTSRIMTKVRSDEGLAYNTGSRFSHEKAFPGTFYGYVQTKSATVQYAISLILKEFERIRKESVSPEELETAKQYFLDSFPDRFSTSIGTMSSMARLEYDGYPMNYFQTYRSRIEAVTAKDVLRVAKKYIIPSEMSMMVVGDIEPCKAGYDKHPGTLDQLGKISVIQLKDPLAD